MSEPKPFASLSSGLLARKGAARPAMKPQGFGQMGGGNLEDLGWNDMGFEPPKPAAVPVRDEDHDAFGEEIADEPRAHPTGLTPVHSPVHTQHAEIADRFGFENPEEECDDSAESDESDSGSESEPEPEPDSEPTPAPLAIVPTPAPAPVVAQVAAPASAKAPVKIAAPAPAPRRSPTPRAAPGSKAKAAFTLRLDPSRHLRLRLACAVGGRSAQQIVTDALDGLLESMPELDAMAEKANRKG